MIEGPQGWDSRSLYFLDPEDIVLELIARDADWSAPAGDGQVPRPPSLSEVGIGDHDGLIILVDQNRVWFPTNAQQPARGP